LQLVHITDLHFGCEDKAALIATAKFIADRKPDAVICTGDLSKDGRQRELDAACDWLRGLEVPVIVTPGNHDVPYYNIVGRVFFPWTRYQSASHDLRQAAWHTPDWSIVPINTARGLQPRMNWAQGAISGRQVALARAELAKAAPGALTIVVTHHPLDWPNDAPIHGATIGGLAGQQALMNAGAQLFLSGHLHFASARLIGSSALSLTSGTLSRRLRHEPCAFTVLRRARVGVLETEVSHVVQGVVECASTRQFRLTPAGSGTGVEIHASL
jgi:3',5'-cyclic AMP phosphodiesterase CpdA